MNAVGSVPRSLMILLVASLFLYFKKKHIFMNNYQLFIYTWISYLIIIIFPFSILTSIAADRLLLYLYPVKVAFVAFADLKDKIINTVIFLIISLYFFYLLIWVCFGTNSFSWVPYKFIGF